MVKMESVSSTNVESVGYDEETNELFIRFKNGSEYVYYDVPIEEYESLLSAGSKGSYVYYSIKDMYSFDRVS